MLSESTTEKPKRVDGQVTGLAGELFVAAELLKRGLQTSVTFGNAKAIDLFAFNPDTGRTFTVQVKASRKKNYFPISHAKVKAAHVYVFVLLNKPGEAVQYFIVPGKALAEEPERFTKWFVDPKFPGIHPNALKDFAENWGCLMKRLANHRLQATSWTLLRSIQAASEPKH
jgi:hypothetical protein